jgi:arabinan endo-1,5-alpha-L-arabinosidase
MNPTRETPVSRGVRWRVVTLAIAGLLVAGAVVAMPQAYAATIDPSAWYQIVSRNSGKVMNIDGAPSANGAGLVQRSATGGTNQQFQFVDAGNGFHRIRARHSGKVVDVQNGSTADGAAVRQWTDTNATAQQFQVVDSDSGYVKFRNRASGKVLDVWGWSTADGARVSQFTDHNGANQQWQLVVVSSGNPGTPPASYPNPIPLTGSTGAHDPAAARTPSGSYLVVTTGNNLPIKTSTNRTSWSNAGAMFPGGAPWTSSYTGGSANLWAPDISFHNGQYYVYYSASTFGSQNSAIFLATSPTGASGSWTNQGLIISSSSAVNYNAIDPNLIVDEQGQWWLTFGSFWTGIKMIRLDPSTGRRSTSDAAVRSIAQRTTAGGAVEAPFVHRHGAYYYLFVSFDRCCQGASSTYRVMVGRSTSVTGPYVDRNGTAMTSGGGTQVLASHGSIHGPGHQAVLSDNGQDVLFYHYYADNGASFLGINPIGWDSAGWPFVH